MQTKRLDNFRFSFVCLATTGIISGLWWGVGRFVMDRLLVGTHVVDVVVVLAMAAVLVRPLQLRYKMV